MLSVDFLVSSFLLFLFLFSNSEQILTGEKNVLYLFLNLCVCDYPKVWSDFACCVILDNQLVSTGFVLNVCVTSMSIMC